MSHLAYIGIGANLGDRQAGIRRACDLLRQSHGIVSLSLSSLHETEPVGGPPGQGPYLNAAARVETHLDAQALLKTLLEIEARLGRQRSEKWGPRVIDLDLLLFDDQVIDTPTLTVPHPRLHERRFVLEPLVEIGGNAVHPIFGLTVHQLLDRLLGRARERGRSPNVIEKPD